MTQLEIYFVIFALLLVVLLYYYLSTRKKRMVEGETVREAPIKEEKLRETVREASLDLTEVRGIGPKRAQKLKDAGISSVRELAKSSEDLAQKIGVSEKIVSKWIKNANEILTEK